MTDIMTPSFWKVKSVAINLGYNSSRHSSLKWCSIKTFRLIPAIHRDSIPLLKLCPLSFPHKRLKDPKQVAARNAYRQKPRRSPRNHRSSARLDGERRVPRSKVVYHHCRGFFFRISGAGYPIIDPNAYRGSGGLYPKFWRYSPGCKLKH
jgi:hypothetical protein